MKTMYLWFVRLFALAVLRKNPQLSILLLWSTGQARDWSPVFLKRMERIWTKNRTVKNTAKPLIHSNDEWPFLAAHMLLSRICSYYETFPHALYSSVLFALKEQPSKIAMIVQSTVAGSCWIRCPAYEVPNPSSDHKWEHIVTQLMNESDISIDVIQEVASHANIEIVPSDLLHRAQRFSGVLASGKGTERDLVECVECSHLAQAPDFVANYLRIGIDACFVRIAVQLAVRFCRKLPSDALILAADKLLEQGQIDDALYAADQAGSPLSTQKLVEWANIHAFSKPAACARALFLSQQMSSSARVQQAINS